MGRFLITGAAGFVGKHLTAYLLANTDATFLCLARSSDGPIDDHPRVSVYRLDLLDYDQVSEMVSSAPPTGVFHLAAQSSTAESFSHRAETLSNNILGQLNVLEALAALDPMPRTIVIGSSDEYGLLRDPEQAIREETELRPATPYAVSKVLQDFLGFQYYAERGLPAIRLRPFNHTGPGHDERFVVPALARQIAEIEAGLREAVVRVGNLEVRRDYTDVRDMVRAYYLALLTGEPGEVYNVGSHQAVSIREILDLLRNVSRVPFEVEVDPSRVRPVDVPVQLCDSSRFRALTGWSPQIPLQRTMADTLDYWRQRIAS